MKKHFLNILLIFLTLNLFSQKDGCEIKNIAFQTGERVTYEISYNWIGIPWLKVGYAAFSVLEKKLNNKNYFYLFGVGSTYESWEWFYKIKATHKSYVDPETLKQIYFKRDVKEPNFFIDIEYKFNWEDTVAYSRFESKKDDLTLDTIKVPNCTFDLMSILYYARNLDYSKYKPGEKIPITLLLDKEITPLYFRYLGKDNLRLRKIGKFECIKLSVFLVEGTMFHEGENMEIWVTNDKNRIPLMIKSPIVVGSVKAKLVSYDGLRNPMDAKR